MLFGMQSSDMGAMCSEQKMRETEQSRSNLHSIMNKVELGRKKDAARLEEGLADVDKAAAIGGGLRREG